MTNKKTDFPHKKLQNSKPKTLGKLNYTACFNFKPFISYSKIKVCKDYFSWAKYMTIFFDCYLSVLIFSLLALRVWFDPKSSWKGKTSVSHLRQKKREEFVQVFFLNCWTIKNAKKIIFMFQDWLVTQGCEDEKEFSYVKELWILVLGLYTCFPKPVISLFSNSINYRDKVNVVM